MQDGCGRSPEFLTELVMTPARNEDDFSDWDGISFRLTEELKLLDSTGAVHVIPAGRVFNGASTDPGTRFDWFNKLVQWIACIFVWPMDKHAEATAFHDYVYGTPTICMARKDVDELFRKLLLVCGIPRWKARGMYWFVRKFGSGRWKERTYIF